MSHYNTAKNFWISQTKYPNYDFIKQRRFYEVDYIFKKINNTQTIDIFTDIGCGDGSLIGCMNYLLDIRHINCLDLSINLMSNIVLNDKISKINIDLSNKKEWYKIPQSSTIYNIGGVISYIFDDNILSELLRHIVKLKHEYFFLRSPCSMLDHDIIINTFSDKLQAHYASVYRTKDKILSILSQSGCTIKDCCRLYPENIESKFDTRQYIFTIG